MSLVTTVMVASLSLTACTGSDPMEDIPAFEVEAASVKLIDAGHGEKHNLTYDSGEQTTEVTVSYGIGQAAVATDKVSPTAPAGGDVQEVTLPLNISLIDGGLYDATVGEPKHSNLDLGKEALSAEGFRMRWQSDGQGNVENVQLLPPEDSSDEGRAVVERALLQVLSTLPVFPADAVGEGAQWSVTSRTMGESDMRRTTTYTVDSIDGGTVTLSLDVADEPTNKELSIDDNESLTAIESNTTTDKDATITVDLSKPLPSKGRNAATTRVVYAGPNKDFRVVQDVTTATTYGE